MRIVWPLAAAAISPALSFQIPPSSIGATRRNSALFGIHEWRDLWFDFPGTGDDRRLGMEVGAPPKSICILPFPYNEVLLPGETKELQLYEDRFIKLFDDVMENHGGVLAMGLLAQSGIIQTVPLAEVEAYNRMDEYGIFVTIRVVGRAELIEMTQQEPYIKGVCTEINDKIPPNLSMPNLVADTIEDGMLTLSSLEYNLNQMLNSEDMDRRISAAKLVSFVNAAGRTVTIQIQKILILFILCAAQ